VKATTFSRVFTVLALAVAAYLAFLLSRYFSPTPTPRFRIETFFMWFVAAGVAAVCLRPSSTAVEDPNPALDAAHFKWVFGAFVAIAFVYYWPALTIGFLSDDFVLAEWASRREWIHVSATGFVRPIVPFIWYILSALPGSLAQNVHIVNVVLHALNATLVAALATRLGARRIEAAAAGLIFLTFPALSEAVVWASGMQDVLMTTFVLASILAVLEVDVSAGAAVAAVGGTVVAILTKETAIVLPALAWLIAWVSPSGIGRGSRRLTIVAMTVVAIVYAVVRAFVGLPSGYGSGVSRYFAKQLIVDPFSSLGAPWSATWIDAHAFIALFRAVVILGLLAAAFARWRRDAGFGRAAVFAGWVLVAVVPVLSLFFVSDALEGSRYLYLPAVGFSLFLATMARTAASLAPARISVVALMTATAVFVLPAFVSAPAELARWTAAAKMRDQILISYVRVMPEVSCGQIVTEGSADSVDGAFVLRNGFTQALADMGVDTTAFTSAPRCRIGWTDHLVVKQE